MTTPRKSSQSNIPLRGATSLLSIAIVLGLGLGAAPIAGGATAAKRALPESVSTPIAAADKALARAVSHISTHHFTKAVADLDTVKHQVWRAHTAGMAQIGLPPTDPESDVPPGPACVLAVLSLEHRVGTAVVDQFDALTKATAIDALRVVLRKTHHRRDVMLDKVISLPPEGAGADYADGMADSLGKYTREVNQVSSALNTFQLTAEAKVALTNALERVRATKAKVNAAWGGGE